MADINTSSVKKTRKASKRTPAKKKTFVSPPSRIKITNTSSTDLELVVREGESFGSYCLRRRSSMEIPLRGVTDQIKELERRQLLVLEMTK